MADNNDIPKEGSLEAQKWVKTVNDIPGIVALSIAGCFIFIIIIILIIQVFRDRNNVWKYFTEYFHLDKEQRDNTRSIRFIVFVILAAGLVFVIYYNINKMINGSPLVSWELIDNDLSPSILFCPIHQNERIDLASAKYAEDVNDFIMTGGQDYQPIKKLVDPQNITRLNGVCFLFNGTLPNPRENVGAFYLFTFSQFNNTVVDIFIGDTSDRVDWTLPFPKNDGYGDVGMQTVDTIGLISYTENRYVSLDGSQVYRSFQCSFLKYHYSSTTPLKVAERRLAIGIIAPKQVPIQVEEPPLRFADLFSNVGGYLSICGIFGFLFGSGNEENQPGFISKFILRNNDRKSVSADDIEKVEQVD